MVTPDPWTSVCLWTRPSRSDYGDDVIWFVYPLGVTSQADVLASDDLPLHLSVAHGFWDYELSVGCILVCEQCRNGLSCFQPSHSTLTFCICEAWHSVTNLSPEILMCFPVKQYTCELIWRHTRSLCWSRDPVHVFVMFCALDVHKGNMCVFTPLRLCSIIGRTFMIHYITQFLTDFLQNNLR